MSEMQSQINPSKETERRSGRLLAAGAAAAALALGPTILERASNALEASTEGLTGESRNITVDFENTEPGQPIDVRTEDN